MFGSSWKTQYRICGAVVCLAFVNFTVLSVAANFLGGNAICGKVEAGRYFLRDHSRFTEVSRTTFTCCLFHGYSVYITHPLALAAIAAMHRLKRRNDPCFEGLIAEQRYKV